MTFADDGDRQTPQVSRAVSGVELSRVRTVVEMRKKRLENILATAEAS